MNAISTVQDATIPFALGRVDDGQRMFTVVVRGNRVLDLDTVAAELGLDAPVTITALLEQWDRVLPVLRGLSTDRPLEGLRVLAPVQPRQVLQSGANYRNHVIDLAMAHKEIADGRTIEEVRAETAAVMDARAATGHPYLFIGLPSIVGGPFDDVVLPGYSDRHDWELELAAVIGARAFRVSRDDALTHVAGYTIVNDLTTRDLVFRQDMPEIGTDWFRGKNAPGFLPTGPWLVPAEDVGDPSTLRITLTVNGETMQDEVTKDMLFDVAAIVSEASQTVPLLPGDLILTGSPAGNGQAIGRFLRNGDVMTGSITALGAQRVRCVSPGAADA